MYGILNFILYKFNKIKEKNIEFYLNFFMHKFF